MSSLDLVKSVEEFLTATSNECYQPGGSSDVARTNLKNQLNLEKNQLEHGLTVHINYACEKCSPLLKFLENLLANPPESVIIGNSEYWNSHIEAGFLEAVKQVISFVKGNP